ncbi:methyltransferase domain-containing protein [Rhodovibrio sodomensis]|nr:methyltransferase domain-containing protein [Rhodovibrio sodomensis]
MARQGKIPWSLRFKAWWNGYSIRLPELSVQRIETALPDHAVRAPEKPLPWDDERISLVQDVWGPGFETPGGGEDVLTLLKPVGLNPKMSIMELGAGLGGATRAVCKEFGVWINGIEGDPDLARAGQKLSEIAGLTKKAPIHAEALREVEIKPNSLDVVFAREAFVTLPDKVRLLHMIEKGLKPKGQLLFTDYVLASVGDHSEELQAWKEGEPDTPAPWAVSDWEDALKELRLDVRIKEDRSDRQIAAIKSGWAEFMQQAALDGRLERYGQLALEECDLWTRRLNALESRALRVFRFHAIKPGTGNTLSDW